MGLPRHYRGPPEFAVSALHRFLAPLKVEIVPPQAEDGTEPTARRARTIKVERLGVNLISGVQCPWPSSVGTKLQFTGPGPPFKCNLWEMKYSSPGFQRRESFLRSSYSLHFHRNTLAPHRTPGGVAALRAGRRSCAYETSSVV